jgi:hypothetical protein
MKNNTSFEVDSFSGKGSKINKYSQFDPFTEDRGNEKNNIDYCLLYRPFFCLRV